MAATENYSTEKEFAGRYRLGDRTLSNPEIYLTEAEFAARYHLYARLHRLVSGYPARIHRPRWRGAGE